LLPFVKGGEEGFRDFWNRPEISAFKLDKGLPFLVNSYSIKWKKSTEY
jgi:hypothetical protein